MKDFCKIISILFGFALLGAIGFGIFRAIKQITAFYVQMDHQYVAIIVTASITLLLCATIISSSIRYAKAQINLLGLNTNKATLYESVLDVWEEAFIHDSGQNHPDGSRSMEKLHVLEKQLLLHGSAPVLKAYLALLKIKQEAGPQSVTIKSSFVKVLFEMRKDIGLSVQGLSEDGILQLLSDDSKHAIIQEELTIPSDRKLRFPAGSVKSFMKK